MVKLDDPASVSAGTDITVAVSCYNEEQSIVPTLTTLALALKKCALRAELIVMDDGSQDGSIGAVREFIAGDGHQDILIVHHRNDVNRGLPWNVFEAARIGRGKHFWVVAGDNTLDEDTYLSMLSQVGRADIIIPNVLRYRGRPLFRRLLSRLYVWIVNTLSGYSIKYYNGSSIYPRSLVTAHADKARGFGYSAELIISLLDQGKSYVEVDVVFNDRTTGKSSAVNWNNLKAVMAFFGRLIRRRWQRRGAARQTGDLDATRPEQKVDAAGQ